MKTSKRKLKKRAAGGERKLSHGMILCNICGNPFRNHSIFDRFCNSCKNHSKVFMFSEWLPETGVSL